MDQLQQLIQIARRRHCAKDFRGDAALQVGTLAFGNILHSAVITDDAAEIVADGPGFLAEPYLAAVTVANLIFEGLDATLFFHQALEFFSFLGIYVNGRADVGDSVHQLLGAPISVHARKSVIHTEIATVWCRLKHSLKGLIEELTKAEVGCNFRERLC